MAWPYVWPPDGSIATTLLAIFLFATSDQGWAIYTTAWSDAPFIVFGLAAFVLVISYRAKPAKVLLISTGLFAALAVLTRYAGVTLIPPLIVAVCFRAERTNSRKVYSNGVDAISVITGKAAVRVPAKFDPVGWKPNQQFETKMANVSKEIFENRAVLVYFDRIEWRYYLPARDELDQTHKLPVKAVTGQSSLREIRMRMVEPRGIEPLTS